MNLNIDGGGKAMNCDKSELHKCDPPAPDSSFSAEEYIEYLDGLISDFEKAAAEDTEEQKRLTVLSQPIFSDYVKENFGSSESVKDTSDALSTFIFLTQKLLSSLTEYRNFLREHPDAAAVIAANTRKTDRNKEQIRQIPMACDTKPYCDEKN